MCGAVAAEICDKTGLLIIAVYLSMQKCSFTQQRDEKSIKSQMVPSQLWISKKQLLTDMETKSSFLRHLS